MRATCGVMSARTPIMRPESWSTTLKVRSSRSCPVPVRSESMYSSSGGMTSSYFFLKKRSRILRRRPSMRIASAGRMSSIYSGRTHFTAFLAPCPEEKKQTDEHRTQADEADLAVAHLRDAPEGVAPQRGREEGKHALQDQHQGERHDERRCHGRRLVLRRLVLLFARGLAERVPEVAQEVGIGLEQHEVVAPAERRAVRLHAAVEGIELGVLVERRGVDR